MAILHMRKDVYPPHGARDIETPRSRLLGSGSWWRESQPMIGGSWKASI